MLSFCPSRSCAVARLRRQVRLRGQSYSALDAELCLWVYTTGVEMVLDTYCAFCGQLSQPARARYYQDGKPLAELMGVNRHILPAACSEFRSNYHDMLGRLVVGRMVREIAAAITIILTVASSGLARTRSRPVAISRWIPYRPRLRRCAKSSQE